MRRMKLSVGTGLLLCATVIGAAVSVMTGRYSRMDVWAGICACLPVVAAILLHEWGHVLAARLCGVRLGTCRVNLFGARLSLAGMLSYRQELLIAAAGPVVNLLSAAVVLLPHRHAGAETVAAYVASGAAGGVFAVSSLGLAGINLLPVRSLDGGRILYCLLSPLCGERIADGFVTVGTVLCLGTLWCFSVYALLRVGEMLSLFAFSLCLLVRMMERGA